MNTPEARDPMAKALAVSLAEAALAVNQIGRLRLEDECIALRSEVAQLRQIADQANEWTDKAEAEVVLLRQELTFTDARNATLTAALKAIMIDANRLCDRGLGGTYEDDCRRSICVAGAALRTPKATP